MSEILAEIGSDEIEDEAVDWQESFFTEAESTKHLLNNEIMSDVSFEFDDGTRLVGHKLILAKRSSVFYNQFYGKKAKMFPVISTSVHEVSSKSFQQLLNFIYTDKMCLDLDILVQSYFLAKKYKIGAMENECLDFSINITVEHFCSIFEEAAKFNCDGITENCMKFFENNSFAILSDSSFLDISGKNLNTLLLSETINCAEVEFCNAVIRWSESACLKNNLEIISANKRKCLGENFYSIRFANMSANEFAKCVLAERQLFQDEEIADIFLHIHENSIGTDRKIKFIY